MDKHTPGPWRVSDENPKIVIEDRLPFYSEGRIVAKVSGYPDSGFFFSDEEAADHARLIAAAPELLEALALAFDFPADVFDIPENDYFTMSVTGRDLQRVRPALAKARGEA